MSDSATPQDNPERDSAPGPAAEPSAAGQPVAAAPEQTPESAAPEAAPASTEAPAPQTPPPTLDLVTRVKQFAQSRSGLWAGVALLCVAAGAVGSVLGAHAVARTDANKARRASHQGATEIASTLKQTLQHEEDFALSASTFFAGNPKASSAEFEAWAKWGDGLIRFPELQKLSLIALVRAPELAEFEARVTGHPVKPLLPTSASSLTSRTTKRLGSRSASSTPATVEYLHVVPSGKRPVYCFAIAGLPKSAARYTPAGLDYCAVTPGLLSSRDSAQSLFSTVTAGRNKALGVSTPIYKGGVPPSGYNARREAFVGWLREVLVPPVVLAQALQGHTEGAVRLRHRSGSSNVVFVSGTPQPGAQSTTTVLRGGWTARSFGPGVDAAVLSNWHALALLIAGCLLSAMLGLLVFLLGGGRGRPAAPAAKVREVPHEDLYDPLTGLPNRALMMDRAERMLARASRESGLLAGALFIDIDWFESVNEKLGPAAGDQMLTIVAERLETVVRAHDTVGRLGGDEFVILVESAARGARLDSLARRVIEALHEPVELEDFKPSIFLTASIGVAFGRYATAADLLRDAQLALEASKAAGKDRYTLFNANMRSVIEGRGVLEIELNAALQQKQFFLLYQPVYNLATRKVVSLETSIRWRHPTQGVMNPEDFIPLAEENGLIVPIERGMLEEACTRAAAWQVAGHGVGVSVPVSANQLSRDGFATDVLRALQQSGIDPSMLTLEIAESTVMRDVDAAAVRFEQMKRLGVRIAIDDFGSGYAHHSDLQRMSLDFLNVDRSSLAASDDEDYRSWLLQAILVLGRDLSLAVVAKGIETFEEMTALQEMGCKMGMGSALGEPVTADAVESLLATDLLVAPPASATLLD
jgi:diguanylate cyclase (GGDEF)-like protein